MRRRGRRASALSKSSKKKIHGPWRTPDRGPRAARLASGGGCLLSPETAASRGGRAERRRLLLHLLHPNITIVLDRSPRCRSIFQPCLAPPPHHYFAAVHPAQAGACWLPTVCHRRGTKETKMLLHGGRSAQRRSPSFSRARGFLTRSRGPGTRPERPATICASRAGGMACTRRVSLTSDA